VTTTYMGGRRGPPEGDERPLRGLPGGRARPRPTPPGADPPEDADRPETPPSGDGHRPAGSSRGGDDRPDGRDQDGVVRPLRPLRVVPEGKPPLRVIPGGAEAPTELVEVERDGHPPGESRQLEAPPSRSRTRSGGRLAGLRRRWVALALLLVVLAGLAVTGRVVAERPAATTATTRPAATGTSPPTATVQPSPVVATIGTGGFANGMTAGAGSLWVAGSGEVTRIDPATNSVAARIPVDATGSGPAAVAFGAGAVWAPVTMAGTLWAIDPSSDKVVTMISLGVPLRGPVSVSATRGAVWVACCGQSGPDAPASGGTLFRVDPGRRRVVAEIALPASPVAVAADPSGAWVATASGQVLAVSARRNRVVDTLDAGGPLGFRQTIAVGAGAVWLADPFDEQVVRIDARTRRVVARIPAGAATTLTVTRDAVWVLSSRGLLRIDPAQDRVVATASHPDLRGARLVTTTGSGAVWTADWHSVSRIDPDLVTP
jgi:DNA-binding beta-propeller fold protein YncE